MPQICHHSLDDSRRNRKERESTGHTLGRLLTLPQPGHFAPSELQRVGSFRGTTITEPVSKPVANMLALDESGGIMIPSGQAAYDMALMRIEACQRRDVDALDLSKLGLTHLPPEIGGDSSDSTPEA